MPAGGEDDEAFRQGIGFTDVVRVPSANARHLTRAVLRQSAPDLLERLTVTGVRPPTKMLFVYSAALDAAAPLRWAIRPWSQAVPGLVSRIEWPVNRPAPSTESGESAGLRPALQRGIAVRQQAMEQVQGTVDRRLPGRWGGATRLQTRTARSRAFNAPSGGGDSSSGGQVLDGGDKVQRFFEGREAGDALAVVGLDIVVALVEGDDVNDDGVPDGGSSHCHCSFSFFGP